MLLTAGVPLNNLHRVLQHLRLLDYSAAPLLSEAPGLRSSDFLIPRSPFCVHSLHFFSPDALAIFSFLSSHICSRENGHHFFLLFIFFTVPLSSSSALSRLCFFRSLSFGSLFLQTPPPPRTPSVQHSIFFPLSHTHSLYLSRLHSSPQQLYIFNLSVCARAPRAGVPLRPRPGPSSLVPHVCRASFVLTTLAWFAAVEVRAHGCSSSP